MRCERGPLPLAQPGFGSHAEEDATTNPGVPLRATVAAGQEAQETASSVVSTPLAAPMVLSGGELVVHRQSADHPIQASDGESDVTHALPEELTSLT
jgi:hypothetical protein